MKLWVTAAVFPPVLWVVVLTMPTVDERWENHPAHFWLVLTAALASVGLGYAVLAAAQERRDKQGDTPDHPERAAQAALRLQAEAERIAADHPDWPRFRTGTNSGDVVAAVVGGPTGHRKHGVVGDTVNLATRLEAAARPGTVVIGEATYRRLAPGAIAERLPPLEVKGKREPVDAYVLHAVPAGTDPSRR